MSMYVYLWVFRTGLGIVRNPGGMGRKKTLNSNEDPTLAAQGWGTPTWADIKNPTRKHGGRGTLSCQVA
jgi:hypothetical protein